VFATTVFNRLIPPFPIKFEDFVKFVQFSRNGTHQNIIKAFLSHYIGVEVCFSVNPLYADSLDRTAVFSRHKDIKSVLRQIVLLIQNNKKTAIISMRITHEACDFFLFFQAKRFLIAISHLTLMLTVKRFLPFARLLLSTSLPALVAILARNPWVVALFLFDG